MAVEGQMLPLERRQLHWTVIDRQPRLALEVGTWKGGGSTLQIVTALVANGGGHLHTCEPDKAFHEQACSVFRGGLLERYVTLHNKPSGEVIRELLAAGQVPDFLFFDGPEDPQVALDDINALSPYLPAGTTLMMHDWLSPESVKQRLIKPYLANSEEWCITNVLGPPHSVGLVTAVKLSAPSGVVAR
jgi:predicted O-methyltransferase YrrM